MKLSWASTVRDQSRQQHLTGQSQGKLHRVPSPMSKPHRQAKGRAPRQPQSCRVRVPARSYPSLKTAERENLLPVHCKRPKVPSAFPCSVRFSIWLKTRTQRLQGLFCAVPSCSYHTARGISSSCLLTRTCRPAKPPQQTQFLLNYCHLYFLHICANRGDRNGGVLKNNKMYFAYISLCTSEQPRVVFFCTAKDLEH